MTTAVAPTFTINGSAVPLVPQAREPFSWLASQVYRHLHDGAQLPAPAPPFGGVIKDNALQSTPWWPPRIVPPRGAPNPRHLPHPAAAAAAAPQSWRGAVRS